MNCVVILVDVKLKKNRFPRISSLGEHLLFSWDLPPVSTNADISTYRGISLIRNSPPSLGPPYDSRYSPTVGS